MVVMVDTVVEDGRTTGESGLSSTGDRHRWNKFDNDLADLVRVKQARKLSKVVKICKRKLIAEDKIVVGPCSGSGCEL